MHELKKAIIDADIKNHGDKIRPPQKPKKEKQQQEQEQPEEGEEADKPMTPPLESDPDPYGLLRDQEMPQAIPGLMGQPPKGSRKSNAAKKKKNQADNVVDDSQDAMRQAFAPNI